MDFRPRKESVKQCIQNLNALCDRNKVSLHWLPAHSGVAGNEMADKLAKRAAGLSSIHLRYRLSRSTLNNHIQNKLLESIQHKWALETQARQTKVFVSSVNRKLSKALLSNPKSVTSGIVRALTGHNCLKNHLATIKVREDPSCDYCGMDETSEHVIRHCTRFTTEREICHISENWVCGSSKNIKQLRRFIASTSLKL